MKQLMYKCLDPQTDGGAHERLVDVQRDKQIAMHMDGLYCEE